MLALLGLLALTGCGTDNSAPVHVSIITGDDRLNLDAQQANTAESYLRGATSQGLVRFDTDGDVIPALAERWIVTDDGLSFIFRLRNTQWENGDPVSAPQVAEALRERLARGTRSRVGRDLGEIREVRDMTGRVLEIRLISPQPDLLSVLAQPELGIRRNGSGTGPMTADRGEQWIVLAPRSEDADPDRPAQAQRQLSVRSDRAAVAISRYSLDQVQMVLGGQFQHLPYLGIAKIPANAIRFDPVSGMFGLMVVEERDILSAPSLREAIAMAIDRDTLLTDLGLAQWQTTTQLVPSGVEGHVALIGARWTNLDLAGRRAIAQARVRSYIANNGAVAPLRIALPQGPGSRLLFIRLRSDLRRIGLEARRVPLAANADLRLLDEVATYNRPTWYLNQISCALRRICDQQGDVILAQAKRAIDPEARAQRLAEAELSMTNANYYIPLGAPVRFSIVRPGLSGFATTENGWHPLPELTEIPR